MPRYHAIVEIIAQNRLGSVRKRCVLLVRECISVGFPMDFGVLILRKIMLYL